MNKKIFIIILCFSFCFSSVASAGMQVTIRDDKNAVTVKGTSDKEDLLVTMLKSGSTMTELYSAFTGGGGNPEDFLLYYKQIETENGKYSDTIMMPDSAQKGEYLLTVGDEQQMVSYSPLSFRLGLVEQFDNAQSVEDIESLIDDNKNYIGLWDMYDNISNTTIVAEIVYERISNFSLSADDLDSWKSIVALINNAILVSALNDNLVDSLDIVKEMIYDDTEIEAMYSLIDSTTKEGVGFVLENCSGLSFKNYLQFKNRLRAQLALQAFNYPTVIDSVNLIGIISTYVDILGLNLTKFNSLSNSNKAACVRKLSGEKCTLEKMNTRLQAIASSFESVVPAGKTSPSINTGVSKSVVVKGDNNPVDEKGPYEVFSDMGNFEWAKDAVMLLQKNGIITGYSDGKFAPANYVTRCEFVAMVVKALYQITDAENTVFSDVAPDYWGYKYIMTAYENGIIKGMDDGRFLPEKGITKEDMAVILSNILNVTTAEENAEKFVDDEEISDYAHNSVYQLKSLGIINGNSEGAFKPKADASRAEAAQMIYNFLEKKGDAVLVSKQKSSSNTVDKHKDEYNLLVALGVVDSTFEYNYNSMVKKDAFTQMVINAAKLSGINNATGNVYADVPITNEQVEAIEMLASLSGENTDGTTYFYPNSHVTLEEAIKIIFDVTGHSNFANAMGDGGYLILANEKGMQKRIRTGWNAEISGNDALMLIRNMLQLGMVRAISKDTYSEDNSVTLLKELHDIYDSDGIICANSLTTFYAESKLQDNTVLLETNGKYIEMNSGITDAGDSLGMYGTVYYRMGKDDSNPVILYVSLDNNKNIIENIDIDDVEFLSETRASYYKNDKKTDLLFSGGCVFIYNDTYYSGDPITKDSLDNKVGNLLAIDNNNDGKYDVIKITAYDTYVVNHVLLSDGIIFDKYDASTNINISPDDFKKYSLKFADGSKAEIADMRDGVVVSIARNSEKCTIGAIEIIISNKKITGIVTEYENDLYPVVTLDYNAKYKLFEKVQDAFPGVGSGVLAYLDAFSNIAYISNSNTGGFYYGLTLDVAKESNLSASVQMKVFSQDNSTHIYTLNDTVTIDGNRYKNAADTYTKLTSLNNFEINGNALPSGVFPMKYLVNSDDKIVEIDTFEMGSEESENSLTSMGNGSFIYTTDGSLGYTIPTKASVNVLRMQLPSSYTKEDIENEDNLGFMSASSAFGRGSAYNLAAFRSDPQSLYPDFIISIIGYGYNYTDPFLIISSINEVYDSASDMILPVVKGMKSGNEISVVVSERFIEDFKNRKLVPGDVIRYIVDNKSKMIGIDGSPATVKYDYIAKKVNLGNIDKGATGDLTSVRKSDASAHLMYGYVKFRHKGLMQLVYITYGGGGSYDIRPNNINWDLNDNITIANIGSSTLVTVFDPSNKSDNQVYSGTYDDIKDFIHNGEEYSRVLLRYRSSELQEIVVFNDASLAK